MYTFSSCASNMLGNATNSLILNMSSRFSEFLRICIFIVLFALAVLATVLMIIPGHVYKKLFDKISKLLAKKPIVGEIIRFLIVGTIATLIDMLVMAIVMYFMQRSIYSSFINVFIDSPKPSTTATIVGTTLGFVVGLAVNYVLSVMFVFINKGNSKTKKGFVVFTVLSVIGLGINVLGTYLLFDLAGLNAWFVKILMVVIVLVYNYISKKLILFKKTADK